MMNYSTIINPFDHQRDLSFSKILGSDLQFDLINPNRLEDSIHLCLVNLIHYYESNLINQYHLIEEQYHEIKHYLTEFFQQISEINQFYFSIREVKIEYLMNSKEDFHFYVEIKYQTGFGIHQFIYPRKLTVDDYINQLEYRINRVIDNSVERNLKLYQTPI